MLLQSLQDPFLHNLSLDTLEPLPLDPLGLLADPPDPLVPHVLQVLLLEVIILIDQLLMLHVVSIHFLA